MGWLGIDIHFLCNVPFSFLFRWVVILRFSLDWVVKVLKFLFVLGFEI